MIGVGGMVVTNATALGRRAFAAESTGLAMPSDRCRPTIRQTEGPFLTPDSPMRSDIREDRQGVPVRLTLNVMDDLWCEPIKDTTVELWHSDAAGLYSGVDNVLFDLQTLRLSGESVDMRGSQFLRGHQNSGDDGKVEFTTIFPGWYPGRLPHFHVKAIIQGLAWTSHITQLYLPSEVEHAVFETAPYLDRGRNPTGVDRDLVVRGDAESVRKLTVPLEKDGEGFRGEFDLAVTF